MGPPPARGGGGWAPKPSARVTQPSAARGVPVAAGPRLRECCGCIEGLQVPGSSRCGGGVRAEPADRGGSWEHRAGRPPASVFLRPRVSGFRGKRGWGSVMQSISPETQNQGGQLISVWLPPLGCEGPLFRAARDWACRHGIIGRRRASPLGCSLITPFCISVRKAVCSISPRNMEGRGRGVLRGGSSRQATSETRG